MEENKIDTGGQAFPIPEECVGMTLRDYFAAKAMQGLIISTYSPYGFQNLSIESCCEYAYKLSDAMIKERNK